MAAHGHDGGVVLAGQFQSLSLSEAQQQHAAVAQWQQQQQQRNEMQRQLLYQQQQLQLQQQQLQLQQLHLTQQQQQWRQPASHYTAQHHPPPTPAPSPELVHRQMPAGDATLSMSDMRQVLVETTSPQMHQQPALSSSPPEHRVVWDDTNMCVAGAGSSDPTDDELSFMLQQANLHQVPSHAHMSYFS